VLAAVYRKGYRIDPDQLLFLALKVGVSVLSVPILVTLFRRHKRSGSGYRKQDGLAFERYVAAILPRLGFTNVMLTERYDLGVDIVAAKGGLTWGIQVKQYNGLVKAAAVRQVVTALNMYGCNRAMVVTNSSFSRPAIALAQSNNCVLIDKHQLEEWITSAKRRY